MSEPIELIKVKIANTEVEIPIYINQQKTYELVSIIENRINELIKAYHVTRTQTFALRVAYEILVELNEERRLSKLKEEEWNKNFEKAVEKLKCLSEKIREITNI